MATRDITLRWADTNIIEQAHKIYRSTSPMDTANMPAPIATLEQNSTSYVDPDRTIGETIYYRVSAWIETTEVFSEELMITVYDYMDVFIGLSDGTIERLFGGGEVAERKWAYQPFANAVEVLAVDHLDYVAPSHYNGVTYIYDGSDGSESIGSYDIGATTLDIDFKGSLIATVNGTYLDVYYRDMTIRHIRENMSGTALSVIIDDDLNVYACRNGNLAKYNYKDGLVWEYTPQNAGDMNAMTVFNGNIYFTRGEYIEAVDSGGVSSMTPIVLTVDPISFLTNDGTNFFILYSSGELIKTDSNFNIIYSRNLSGTINDFQVDENGNIYVAIGNTLYRYDSMGNEIWNIVSSNGNVINALDVGKNQVGIFAPFNANYINFESYTVNIPSPSDSAVPPIDEYYLVQNDPLADYTTAEEKLIEPLEINYNTTIDPYQI